MISLPKVSDKELHAEAARRRGAKRKDFSNPGGRPPKMTPCPLCSVEYSARDMHRHYNRANGKHRSERV